MKTDIKLDEGRNEDQVVIESNVLRSTAADFILASPARRKNPRLRRALVHNQKDGLTINFNYDYPGGVTINDVVAMTYRADFKSLAVSEISGTVTKLDPLVPGGGFKKLALRGNILIEPQPPSPPRKAKRKREIEAQPLVSLQALLSDMQAEMERLNARVEQLERARKAPRQRGAFSPRPA